MNNILPNLEAIMTNMDSERHAAAKRAEKAEAMFTKLMGFLMGEQASSSGCNGGG